MNVLSRLPSVGLFSMLLVVCPQAISGGQQHEHKQHREHGAHEHGAALLNVAIEENSLHLELESPAMNIVGFEHVPKTRKQKHAVAQAAAELKNGNVLFVLSSAAQCRLAEVEVESPLLEKEHAHDKHEDERKESHSEFNAAYVFQCKNIKLLKEMDVQLFNKFKTTEKIRVQLISSKGQTVKELTTKYHKLTFFLL